MDSLGWLHTISATLAIGFGTFIVRKPKGTREHRMIGRAYVLCLVFCCGSAFAIYNLYGTFGPFHWTSIGETYCLTRGLAPLFFKVTDPNWRAKHAFYMSWSYVGLLAALAGEIMARVPDAPFNLVVWTSVAIVVLIGSRVIRKTLGRAWLPPEWSDDRHLPRGTSAFA